MKGWKLGLSAAVLLAAILLVLYDGSSCLVVRDLNTDQVYYRCPMEAGQECSIEFTHSVNKTSVRDLYRITEEGTFHNFSCIYYSFGAGVQTELEAGESLSYEDGAMIISGIEKYYPQLIFGVLTTSTHTLRVGGEEIFLPGLLEKDSILMISYERKLFKYS